MTFALARIEPPRPHGRVPSSRRGRVPGSRGAVRRQRV